MWSCGNSHNTAGGSEVGTATSGTNMALWHTHVPQVSTILFLGAFPKKIHVQGHFIIQAAYLHLMYFSIYVLYFKRKEVFFKRGRKMRDKKSNGCSRHV